MADSLGISLILIFLTSDTLLVLIMGGLAGVIHGLMFPHGRPFLDALRRVAIGSYFAAISWLGMKYDIKIFILFVAAIFADDVIWIVRAYIMRRIGRVTESVQNLHTPKESEGGDG